MKTQMQNQKSPEPLERQMDESGAHGFDVDEFDGHTYWDNMSNEEIADELAERVAQIIYNRDTVRTVSWEQVKQSMEKRIKQRWHNA